MLGTIIIQKEPPFLKWWLTCKGTIKMQTSPHSSRQFTATSDDVSLHDGLVREFPLNMPSLPGLEIIANFPYFFSRWFWSHLLIKLPATRQIDEAFGQFVRSLLRAYGQRAWSPRLRRPGFTGNTRVTWGGTSTLHQVMMVWGFPKIGVPQNGWFIMEDLIKMDDLGGTTIFGNIHIPFRRLTYPHLRYFWVDDFPSPERWDMWAFCGE